MSIDIARRSEEDQASTQSGHLPALAALPAWSAAWGEAALAARGRQPVLEGIVARSPVPMLVVDSERRFIEANPPARLAFRSTLEELRQKRIDDLTPLHRYPVMEEAWGRLVGTGSVAGPYEVAVPDGSRLDVTFFAVADVLPDRHLILFAPAGWPEAEFADGLEPPESPLTARELEVLQLAADGHSAPAIAERLFVSSTTINTHFANVYAKLGVRHRAAAVARAIRLGLIA